MTTSVMHSAICVKWSIDGLTCAAEAIHLERRLRTVPGVLDAAVNPVNERAFLTFDGTLISESELLEVIERLGYRAG